MYNKSEHLRMTEKYLLELDCENMSVKQLEYVYSVLGTHSSTLCDNDIRNIIIQYRILTKKEFNYHVKHRKEKTPIPMKKAPRKY